MFIYVTYKDPPDLSGYWSNEKNDDSISGGEESVEKQLLVNPDCYARIMLEYIRKKCRLAAHTVFDICDENGNLKEMFQLATYTYASYLFEHKKIYYLVVIKEGHGQMTVLPQINRDNKLYNEIQSKVTRYKLTHATPVHHTPSRDSLTTTTGAGAGILKKKPVGKEKVKK